MPDRRVELVPRRVLWSDPPAAEAGSIAEEDPMRTLGIICAALLLSAACSKDDAAKDGDTDVKADKDKTEATAKAKGAEDGNVEAKDGEEGSSAQAGNVEVKSDDKGGSVKAGNVEVKGDDKGGTVKAGNVVIDKKGIKAGGVQIDKGGIKVP